MQPAQYPMKNIQFTKALLVLPLTFEAESERRIDIEAVMQDDYPMSQQMSDDRKHYTYHP